MTTIVAVRGLLSAAEKINAAPSSLCCDHCRGKLRLGVHRYWRMRFSSAACMSAYQQRLSPRSRKYTRSMVVVRRGKRRAETRTMEKFMPRSLTKRVMPDRSKITVTSEHKVKYWIKHFGVTREELERAIERVGNSAASVRKELRNLALDPP